MKEAARTKTMFRGNLSPEIPAHVPRIGSTDRKYDQLRCAGDQESWRLGTGN
jgi:hypothetical protein